MTTALRLATTASTGLLSFLLLTGCGSEATVPTPQGAPAPSPFKTMIVDSGPLTALGDGLKLTPVPNSSLHRAVIFVNDTAAPVRIDQAVSNFGARSEGRALYGRNIDQEVSVTAVALQNVAAVSLRVVNFDIFNSQFSSELSLWPRDIRPGAPETLKWTGLVDKTKLSSLLTVVVYFEQVRTTDGKLWNTDLRLLNRELRKLNLQPIE